MVRNLCPDVPSIGQERVLVNSGGQESQRGSMKFDCVDQFILTIIFAQKLLVEKVVLKLFYKSNFSQNNFGYPYHMKSGKAKWKVDISNERY